MRAEPHFSSNIIKFTSAVFWCRIPRVAFVSEIILPFYFLPRNYRKNNCFDVRKVFLGTCKPRKCYDQPAHARGLVKMIVVRLTYRWIIGYVKSAQRRLRSDCASAQSDLSLRSAHIAGEKLSRVEGTVMLHGNAPKERASLEHTLVTYRLIF